MMNNESKENIKGKTVSCNLYAVSPAGTTDMKEFMFEGNRVLYENGKMYFHLSGKHFGRIQHLVNEVKW